MLIPETHGGLGLGALDAAIAAEELGRGVAPAPVVASGVMAAIALTAAGLNAQKDQWLPGLADGSRRIGVGAAGAVEADGAGLSGRVSMALDAAGADAFLVTDTRKRLYLVDAQTAGLTVTPEPAIDATRSITVLHLDKALCTAPLPWQLIRTQRIHFIKRRHRAAFDRAKHAEIIR